MHQLRRKIRLVLCTLLICSQALHSQDLLLISWNLRDFGQSRDAAEMELIANELRDADIVAIQEVVAKHPGGAQAVARLADQLNRMGSKWDYRISDPTQSSSPYKRSVLHGEKTSLRTTCKNGNYLSRAEDNILYNFSTLDFENGRILDFIRNGNYNEVNWKRTSLSDHLGVWLKVGI